MLENDSILLIRYFFTWYLNLIAIPVIFIIYWGLIKKEKISTLLDHKMEPFRKFKKYTSIIISVLIAIRILNIITLNKFNNIFTAISILLIISYLQLLSVYISMELLFWFIAHIEKKKN